MPLPRYERGLTRHPLCGIPEGMRGTERTVAVPQYAHEAVGALITSWEFKRRAGFEAPMDDPVAGQEGSLGKTVLGMHFAEPVRVVWADEHGFGYETRPGHPIYGPDLRRGIVRARRRPVHRTIDLAPFDPAMVAADTGSPRHAARGVPSVHLERRVGDRALRTGSRPRGE